MCNTVESVLDIQMVILCVVLAALIITRILMKIVNSEWFSWFSDRRWVKLKGSCPRCRDQASIYSDHIYGDKFQVYFCASCGFRAGPTVEGYIEGEEPARSHHWRFEA